MTGPHDGILGRRVDRVLETTLSFRPTHFEVAIHDVRLNATLVEVCPETGRAQHIQRIVVTEELLRRWAQEDRPATASDAQQIGRVTPLIPRAARARLRIDTPMPVR